MVVGSAGEQRERLLAWQAWEWQLVETWWAARRELEETAGARDAAVAGRDRAVSRVLGGMTAKQQAWVQRHLSFATRPLDASGRQLVLTWLQGSDRVRACQVGWADRIDRAQRRMTAAEEAFAIASDDILAALGSRRSGDLLGVPRQRLTAWARPGGGGSPAARIDRASR